MEAARRDSRAYTNPDHNSEPHPYGGPDRHSDVHFYSDAHTDWRRFADSDTDRDCDPHTLARSYRYSDDYGYGYGCANFSSRVQVLHTS